jgi:hypothetical protein
MRTQAQSSVQELGELGKQYARARAPYYSGATFRNIVLMRGKGKYEARILAKNPTANDGHSRRIANFNLVRWMHQSPKAEHHIKSGDRQFMYSTRRYLSATGKARVTGSFKSVILKT